MTFHHFLFFYYILSLSFLWNIPISIFLSLVLTVNFSLELLAPVDFSREIVMLIGAKTLDCSEVIRIKTEKFKYGEREEFEENDTKIVIIHIWNIFWELFFRMKCEIHDYNWKYMFLTGKMRAKKKIAHISSMESS